MAGEWNVRANLLLRAYLSTKAARRTTPLPEAPPLPESVMRKVCSSAEERAAFIEAIGPARTRFARTVRVVLVMETVETAIEVAPLAGVLALTGLLGFHLAAATAIVFALSVVLGYVWGALRARAAGVGCREMGVLFITVLPGTLLSNAITVAPPIVAAWLLMRVSGLGLLTSAGIVVAAWLVFKLARYIPVLLLGGAFVMDQETKRVRLWAALISVALGLGYQVKSLWDYYLPGGARSEHTDPLRWFLVSFIAGVVIALVNFPLMNFAIREWIRYRKVKWATFGDPHVCPRCCGPASSGGRGFLFWLLVVLLFPLGLLLLLRKQTYKCTSCGFTYRG